MNLVPLGEAHLPGLAHLLNDLPGMRGWDVGWAGPISFYARAVGARVGRAF